MKENAFLILFIFCLSISVFSQTEVVTVFEAVKIKNGKRAEALFYYENNWKKLREKASAKGYIHSYELIESKAEEKADFDIVLITRYANQTQFNKAEENFQELIKQRDGLKLLNDLKPGDFRENIFVKIGKSGTTDSFTKDPNAKNECPSEEIKAFDFLLGNWKQKGSLGKMQISKILDGCGIQEIWQLEEFNAILLRSYDNKTKKWYLTFTAHDLVPQVWEGRRENGNWIFYRDWELNGKKRRSRTFWTKDSDKGFTKIVEQLNDDGKTWRLHAKAEFEK